MDGGADDICWNSDELPSAKGPLHEKIAQGLAVGLLAAAHQGRLNQHEDGWHLVGQKPALHALV